MYTLRIDACKNRDDYMVTEVASVVEQAPASSLSVVPRSQYMRLMRRARNEPRSHDWCIDGYQGKYPVISAPAVFTFVDFASLTLLQQLSIPWRRQAK